MITNSIVRNIIKLVLKDTKWLCYGRCVIVKFHEISVLGNFESNSVVVFSPPLDFSLHLKISKYHVKC